MHTSRILVLDRGEELAAQIQKLAEDLQPRPDVVVCSRIGSVGDVITDDGPFDVLVAGPSLGTRSGLSRLRIIREECPGMATVLAFSRRPDASLRDIVRTGAVDLLQLPVDDKDVLVCMERALGMSVVDAPDVEVADQPPEEAAAVAAPPPSEETVARVFTISSATGGCGKTFFATNLAYFLTHFTEQRVCIVDLDLQFGEVSTAMRLRPKYTIYDALQRGEDDSEVLANHIDEYMVTHETGVHVLAAPRDPSEADRISPPDVTRVLSAIRQRYDWVIVDTPPALSEIVLAAFDLSDELYVMATLDLPSVRNMSVFLGTVERLKIPQDNIRLLMNKAETDVGIEVDQVTKLFPRGFDAILPYAKEVSRSINLGMPVMAASPNAEISRLLAGGIKRLLPVDQQVQAELEYAPRRGGRFRRKK